MASSLRIGQHAVHPFAARFPQLGGDEFARLVESIRTNGLRAAIMLSHDGTTILDGANRYRACIEAASVPFFERFENEDEAAIRRFIFDANVARRHLQPSQVAMYVVDFLLPDHRAAAAERRRSGKRARDLPGNLQEGCAPTLAAREAGLKDGTNVRVGEAIKEASEDVAQLIRDGVLTMHAAKSVVATFGGDELPRVAKRIASGEKARDICYQAAHKRAMENAKSLDVLAGPFDLIYADPPWLYEEGATDPTRDVQGKYAAMDTAAICAMPVSSVVAENAVLALWTTVPKLPEQLRVIESWGFDYKTQMVWVKTTSRGTPFCGQGHWTRIGHEILMIATRGNVPTPPTNARPPSVLLSTRLGHSEKPSEIRTVLERMFPHFTRRLELFARQQVKGWTGWGAEIPDGIEEAA